MSTELTLCIQIFFLSYNRVTSKNISLSYEHFFFKILLAYGTIIKKNKQTTM